MDNLQTPPPEKATEQYGGNGCPPLARPGRRGLYTVIAILVLLTVAAVFARGRWLRIRHAEVNGLVTLSQEQALKMAGITEKSTYLNLNEKRIRENIEKDIRLRYIGMEKGWPDSVTLYVEERQPVANVLFMGMQYVISQDGMVLASSRDLQLDNGCVHVTGLAVRDIRYGAPLLCQDEYQLEAMKQVIEELRLQGVLAKTAELNLSSLDSIFLVTLDGYTANIGSASRLRAKIGTVRAVVQELRRQGYEGGVIEATLPGEASYRPVQ